MVGGGNQQGEDEYRGDRASAEQLLAEVLMLIRAVVAPVVGRRGAGLGLGEIKETKCAQGTCMCHMRVPVQGER
jgi:hypothetical protein